MLSNKERSGAIRNILKKAGYKLRDFSIRSRDCGYSDETRIHVKNLSIKTKEIENLVKGFEEVERDEYSGEILSGGNTYIFVDYDYDTLYNEGERLKGEIAEILNKVEEEAESNENNYAYFELGDLRLEFYKGVWTGYEKLAYGCASKLFSDLRKKDIPSRISHFYAIEKAQAA